MSRTPIRDALKRLSCAPFNPSNPRSRHSPRIRHSREGGNPRTNIPPENANRDITTYVHTATPLRRSGPQSVIGTKACPGLRSGMLLNGFRVRRRPLHSSFPRSKACPVPRYGGGNPRTNTPRENANRDITTYVHTATPLRLSGESTPRTPIRRRNPEGCGRRQFSYPGVPATAGTPGYENRPLWQPLIRHSRHPFVDPAPQLSFRRRPESRRGGRGKATRRWKKLTRRPIFILLCGLRKTMVIPIRIQASGPFRIPTAYQRHWPARYYIMVGSYSGLRFGEWEIVRCPLRDSFAALKLS